MENRKRIRNIVVATGGMEKITVSMRKTVDLPIKQNEILRIDGVQCPPYITIGALAPQMNNVL